MAAVADGRTLDPDIEIVARLDDGPLVQYRRLSTGDLWAVRGVCNRCGLCAIGVDEWWNLWVGPPGTPYSNVDLRVALGRVDAPVTPAFFAAMARMAEQVESATVHGCSLMLASDGGAGA